MIQKYYEVICDYCLTAIWHGISTKKITLQEVKNNHGFIIGEHHFCNKECYHNWLNNNKQDFTKDGNKQ